MITITTFFLTSRNKRHVCERPLFRCLRRTSAGSSTRSLANRGSSFCCLFSPSSNAASRTVSRRSRQPLRQPLPQPLPPHRQRLTPARAAAARRPPTLHATVSRPSKTASTQAVSRPSPDVVRTD